MRMILLFLLVCSVVEGEIYELAHFGELKHFLAPGTDLIVDIDDTLMVPVQMLGCDEWFLSRVKVHQQNGCSASESLEEALAEWESVRHLTKMELVEPGIDRTVREIQSKGYRLMGLTVQGLALATRTKQQLGRLGIDLRLTSPASEDHFVLVNGHGVLLRSGILFTSGMNKGAALFALFDSLGYCPERLVVIDDKRSHLLAVEGIAQERGIAFVGLRYGYSDRRKAAYNDEMAHYQFTHSTFTHLISDEEAFEKCRS